MKYCKTESWTSGIKVVETHLPKPHDPYIHSFECVTVHNNSPKTKRDYNESGTIISMYHKLKR